MEAVKMVDQWKLVGTLERFADKTRESSLQDQDVEKRAYKAGKAYVAGPFLSININETFPFIYVPGYSYMVPPTIVDPYAATDPISRMAYQFDSPIIFSL